MLKRGNKKRKILKTDREKNATYRGINILKQIFHWKQQKQEDSGAKSVKYYRKININVEFYKHQKCLLKKESKIRTLLYIKKQK